MNDEVINKLKLIQHNIENLNQNTPKPNIICVSKTFSIDKLKPLIDFGHRHFGENKVQEAVEKWSDIKNDFKNIKLHMIGKLQTNKVKNVIPLFDYIHSVDNLKLAEKISNEQVKKNKIIKSFIQINIGNEKQKNGILLDQLDRFYNICKNEFGLNIIGLMCLPPNNKKSSTYFSSMQQLANKLSLKEISMGMSSDYLEAINYQSTYLRIGSKIFGERNQ